MFSRWLVTNNTSARETLHCRKTRIHCGNQLLTVKEVKTLQLKFHKISLDTV
jgi:hypothetical protein